MSDDETKPVLPGFADGANEQAPTLWSDTPAEDAADAAPADVVEPQQDAAESESAEEADTAAADTAAEETPAAEPTEETAVVDVVAQEPDAESVAAPSDEHAEPQAVADEAAPSSEVEPTADAETPDEDDTEVPYVTSLAPQLSHVDVGHVEIEVSPPASFNPFALFQAPEEIVRPVRDESADDDAAEDADSGEDESSTAAESPKAQDSADDDDSSSRRRRRGRRGRNRGADSDEGSDDSESQDESADEQPAESRDKRDAQSKGKSGNGSQQSSSEDGGDDDSSKSSESSSDDSSDDEPETSSRRRRRRRRRGSDNDSDSSSSSNGAGENAADKVKGVSGSVRLEAKRQRRKEGRDHGRRRAPILTEAEFLARRESVTRKMVVRQQGERTQIAVLEDDVLVEHYVTLASEQSFAGGVYLGRVQNVLPSMEAAFIDIGKRRNAVLYAGEVNWDAAGLAGKQRSIEQALKSGDKVLVQVTKDPIGHKGARLTSQISLPGRYLVYVPGGSMTGISRKLPEQERARLKEILRRIVPEDAGVIIRTAAEGASEEELNRDVQRLKAQWEVIEKKAADTKTKAPSVLYEEPDLAIRVVRDLFNEDFAQMTISGDGAWDTIATYIQHVAPDLVDRISQADPGHDVFKEYRIDEQLVKALDRKVYLPSGGSLVIDRTEAMTVIDVNTGKFTGSGGNLEQTVTKNNLEAAEEIVRQLRLRDVGGIVVIDFIDMLLESNRELVLRRLTECLGRDRTKHQVAEVTSLGLVQMTRKRVGQGLIDAFSEPCPHCDGRGIIVHDEPLEKKTASTGSEPTSRRGSRSRRGGKDNQNGNGQKDEPRRDSTQQLSAIAAAIHKDEGVPAEESEPVAAPEPANVQPSSSDATAATADAQEAPAADADSVFETFSLPDEPAAAKAESSKSEKPKSEKPKSAPRSRRATSKATKLGAPKEAAQPAATAPDTASATADAEPAVSTSAAGAAGEGSAEPAPAEQPSARPATRRRRAARRPAGPPSSSSE